jgi:Predicted chitinase
MAEKQLTSVTKLYKIYPKAKPGIFEVLDTEMTKENFTLIDKENFLAQAAHESNGFSTFVENLNYSADGLRRVFGKYFKNKDINYYARNPERIGSLCMLTAWETVMSNQKMVIVTVDVEYFRLPARTITNVAHGI